MATRHGERIAASIGMDPTAIELDLTGIKAGFGVDPSTTGSLTYRDLQERRELIRRRLEGRRLL
jgi:hypothetical protein